MRFHGFACLLLALLCSVLQASETEPLIDEAVVQEPVQELLYDRNGLLRLHLYDGEETSLLSADSSRTVVTKADGVFTRNLYDGEYRLQSRITWLEETLSTADFEPSLTPAQIAVQEEYFYYDNSRNRQRVVQTDFQKKNRIEYFYSSEGLLTREETYEPDGKKALEQQVKAELKDSKSQDATVLLHLSLNQVVEYFYNSENDLIEKRITHHGGENALVEKTLYHRPGNIHGGYDYFENEKLLVSRKYEDESAYTETRYFNNMKIETRHNGARLLSEVVYLDGKEIRRTEY